MTCHTLRNGAERASSTKRENRRSSKLMLERWADPTTTFWTMLENRPRSAMAGMFQRHRGVRSGMADLYVVYRGKPIHVELKSPVGMLSKTQRQVRHELLVSGADWWLARSANAAMLALSLSGVAFREIDRSDGTIEYWQRPELQEWEQPTQDPSQPHRSYPELTAKRREAKCRQRAAARQRLQLQQASRVSTHSAPELTDAVAQTAARETAD